MKSRLIISYALYCVGITFRLLNRARLERFDNVSVGKLAFLQSKESREKKNWSEVPALWRIWLWQLQVHSHLSRNSREEPARAFSEIRDLQRNKSTDLSGARDVGGVCRSVRAFGPGCSGSTRGELQPGERRVHWPGLQSCKCSHRGISRYRLNYNTTVICLNSA